MRSSWKSILLWLFVINLGIACGAGLYEARVVIPQWAEIPPQSWPNTGLMFWVYVTTIPLTVLTVANLIAAWMDSSPRRSCGSARRASSCWSASQPLSTSFRPWSVSAELPDATVKAALAQ